MAEVSVGLWVELEALRRKQGDGAFLKSGRALVEQEPETASRL